MQTKLQKTIHTAVERIHLFKEFNQSSIGTLFVIHNLVLDVQVSSSTLKDSQFAQSGTGSGKFFSTTIIL